MTARPQFPPADLVSRVLADCKREFAALPELVSDDEAQMLRAITPTRRPDSFRDDVEALGEDWRDLDDDEGETA